MTNKDKLDRLLVLYQERDIILKSLIEETIRQRVAFEALMDKLNKFLNRIENA